MSETQLSEVKGAMTLLPAASGTCVHCATEHKEHEPHNWWSIFYGMRFKMQYGRDATHADCVAHLPEETRHFYKEALRGKSIEWTDTEEPIREPYAMSERKGTDIAGSPR